MGVSHDGPSCLPSTYMKSWGWDGMCLEVKRECLLGFADQAAKPNQ